MALIEDLADQLAADTMTAMREMGDDQLYMQVSKVLGASSQTLQEAFLTSIRIRQAEVRARQFLEQTIAAARSGAAPPEAPRPAEDGH
ncbi:hypothetical protein [Phaeovulum vinaykumarii]|uniref:Uncharacterized protein n=1 Tax=Phaeovulum vinaykumarii TaxID=407234 RepID=A0A1N7JIS3_9RHOB|nr:hypothetical protein [Phaeovulum vinaykumarii]SIS49218.1 hypothetical protein SAMN05421795_10123 [Phaeovulum vinaykumarii]SOB89477.1 hypothetical protein SAMN05878426_10123 [Phaeovulum vinaykumarii]